MLCIVGGGGRVHLMSRRNFDQASNVQDPVARGLAARRRRRRKMMKVEGVGFRGIKENLRCT